jgi:hypothetical protein
MEESGTDQAPSSSLNNDGRVSVRKLLCPMRKTVVPRLIQRMCFEDFWRDYEASA